MSKAPDVLHNRTGTHSHSITHKPMPGWRQRAACKEDFVLETRSKVCIRKTATRHKRGEGNRSDRNFKATIETS